MLVTSSLEITNCSGLVVRLPARTSSSVCSESSSYIGLLSETYEFSGMCFCLVAVLMAVIICLVIHNSAKALKDDILSGR